MSLISFLKEAGEKLFNHGQAASSTAPSAPSAAQPNVEELNETAGAAIEKYIAAQGLSAEDLDVQ